MGEGRSSLGRAWRRLPRSRWKRVAVLVVGGIIILFGVIQLVPYGRDHADTPVLAGPRWDSPRTAALWKTACADCHSNLTLWPWYTNVAPSSWLVQRDVDEGRNALNVSELGRTRLELDEIAEVIREGSMPPWQYRIIHRDASLSSAEKDALINGLSASLGP